MSMTPAAGPGGRFRVRMPRPLYLQLLFVTLAFVLLVGTCGLYVSNMMREDLIGEAEDILLQTEIRITAELLEPEALMISVAKDIRDIIREGGSANDVRLYIDEISAELTAKVKGFHFDGIHGYFEALGNTYLPASGWFPPEDFSPTDRPWYITAVEAEGRIAVTPPYRSTRSGLYQVSYSCRLFDDAGSPMGAVALNVPLDNITRFVADTSLTENGYGVLIDERFDVIAHPVTEFIGRPMREIGHDVAELLAALEQGWNIAEFEMTNYQGETTVLFCLELDNGWYLGVMTPKSEYYQRLTVLMLYLCALGTVLMLTLILILIRIDAAKTRLDRAFEAQSVQLALMEEMREEDERTQIMLDSMPLCANFWSRDYTNTFTNEKSVQLFELSSKQEYIDRFHDLSPERQPDGEPSSEKAVRLVKEAFETGYCRFEWLHQKLNGEPLPCEITLARVRHRDNDIVLGYTRDLREEKAMLRKVMERGNLLETVSRAAAILLSIKDETAFEAALLESLELLGHCVDADRMHIWRCETAPGASRFILQHQWEGDGARDKVCVFPGTSVPRGALSEWEDTLSRGECVNIIISELPPERHGFFSGFDLRSLALLPLFRRNQLWGLLAIDDCRRERIFSAEEIGILRSAGLMILSAIHRNEMLSTIRSDGEKTRAQAHWYKSILDAIPLPLSITDADMNWTFVNTAVESFLERRREDMLGRHCSHWDAHICNTAHCGIACVKRGEHRTFFKQKGLSFQVDVEILKDLEGKTTGYIEVVQDITQIEEMARRQVEVEAANKAKSTFLATMSHEIRTPINAILGISEIQLQHRSLLPETREAFSEIYDSGHWLLNIINDILDLSKIEAGKLELMPVKYDIPSLINDTVQLNRLRYESKPIDFKLHVDPDTPIDLIGDELRIKQILNNLLSNAFKYTDAGEIALSISALTEETEGAGTTLVLRVSDTGQGMTESQIAEIFDEYTRFNMDLNRATVGTGLGMNITKRLTDLMHGEISVESTVGEGTVFIVSLPQERVGTALCGEELAEQLRKFRFPGAAKMKMAQIMREYMPYGSVLVVDDVESNLYVARGLLLPYGLRVDSAVNGVAALEKIRSGNRYDIVFMDHMMPKMDGIETTKRLRGMGYTDPVVALTANALAGQAEMFMANGFDGFISKPIDSRELNAVLNTLIRDKQPPGVIEAARKEQERGQPQTDASESKKPLNREIARFFVKDAENAAATLEEIYAREDAGGKMHIYTATAHGVKSALANVGENELSAVAYKLEQAGRGQDMGAIIAETPAFLDALRALIAKIKPVTEIAEAEASGEDLDYLRYKLAGIKAACAVFDKKAVRAALNDLDKKVWPRRIREALDAVAAHLLHSDFPQAAQTADRIIAEIN